MELRTGFGPLGLGIQRTLQATAAGHSNAWSAWWQKKGSDCYRERKALEKNRGERIRTSGILLPKQAR